MRLTGFTLPIILKQFFNVMDKLTFWHTVSQITVSMMRQQLVSFDY